MLSQFWIDIYPFHWNSLTPKMLSVNIHQNFCPISRNCYLSPFIETAFVSQFSIWRWAQFLVASHFIIGRRAQFLVNGPRWHISVLGKVKIIFWESEFQWNGYMTFLIPWKQSYWVNFVEQGAGIAQLLKIRFNGQNGHFISILFSILTFCLPLAYLSTIY